jgi:F-type H+-transporting ATPase subunit epsilon
MRFQLVTPERTLVDEPVASVTLPAAEGEITILPKHAQIAALLVPGVIRFRRAPKDATAADLERRRKKLAESAPREGTIMEALDSDYEETVAVSGGFIHVSKDGNVMVLADTAERGEELDLSVIEEARERARQVMRKAVATDDVAFASAAAALERELARYRVASKYKRPARTLPAAEQATIREEENEP